MTEKVVYLVDRVNNVVSWQVRANMTKEDAVEASVEIKKAVESFPNKDVKLLVDNRYMMRDGRPIVFTNDVNEVWEQLQIYLIPKVSKVAVLCSIMTLKIQMERVAKESGLIAVLKSFYDFDPKVSAQQAYEFLEISGNQLIDSEFTPL